MVSSMPAPGSKGRGRAFNRLLIGDYLQRLSHFLEENERSPSTDQVKEIIVASQKHAVACDPNEEFGVHRSVSPSQMKTSMVTLNRKYGSLLTKLDDPEDVDPDSLNVNDKYIFECGQLINDIENRQRLLKEQSKKRNRKLKTEEQEKTLLETPNEEEKEEPEQEEHLQQNAPKKTEQRQEEEEDEDQEESQSPNSSDPETQSEGDTDEDRSAELEEIKHDVDQNPEELDESQSVMDVVYPEEPVVKTTPGAKGKKLNQALVLFSFQKFCEFLRKNERQPTPDELATLLRSAYEASIESDPRGSMGEHRDVPPTSKMLTFKSKSIEKAFAKLQFAQKRGKKPAEFEKLSKREQHIIKCAKVLAEIKKLAGGAIEWETPRRRKRKVSSVIDAAAAAQEGMPESKKRAIVQEPEEDDGDEELENEQQLGAESVTPPNCWDADRHSTLQLQMMNMLTLQEKNAEKILKCMEQQTRLQRLLVEAQQRQNSAKIEFDANFLEILDILTTFVKTSKTSTAE